MSIPRRSSHLPVLALLVTAACAADPGDLAGAAAPDEPAVADQAATVSATTEVARVVASDGTLWRFLEADPGSLFVWATATNAVGQLANPDPTGQLSYVDLYRKLAAAPAPRALVEAQARAEVVEPEPAVDDSGLVNEAGGATTRAAAPAQVTATYFQDHDCSNVWDYLYCWPSFVGNPYVQRKGLSMHGYIAAVASTLTFRLRYKKHSYSGWTTLVSAQALPGQVHYVEAYYFGYRRWRRLEVLDNGANLVRYSNYGND